MARERAAKEAEARKQRRAAAAAAKKSGGSPRLFEIVGVFGAVGLIVLGVVFTARAASRRRERGDDAQPHDLALASADEWDAEPEAQHPYLGAWVAASEATPAVDGEPDGPEEAEPVAVPDVPAAERDWHEEARAAAERARLDAVEARRFADELLLAEEQQRLEDERRREVERAAVAAARLADERRFEQERLEALELQRLEEARRRAALVAAAEAERVAEAARAEEEERRLAEGRRRLEQERLEALERDRQEEERRREAALAAAEALRQAVAGSGDGAVAREPDANGDDSNPDLIARLRAYGRYEDPEKTPVT